MEIAGFLHTVEMNEGASTQNCAACAIGFERAGVVRNHDERRAIPTRDQRLFRFGAKALIAGSRHLVYQIAFEIHGDADAECEAGAHAGRISAYRLIQIRPELREILHESEQLFLVPVVDARDETGIVRAGQAGLKAAAVSDWPGCLDGARYFARGRLFHAGDQAHQGRFTRAVRAANPDRFTFVDHEIQVIKYQFLEVPQMIGFGNVLEADHGETRSAMPTSGSCS